MKTTDYDYLIIGQGLAGTTLAWHLLEAGKRVLVINDTTLPSASLVAAGIYNPLTGRKLVKTWLADVLFPYALKFYHQLETKLSIRLVYPANIFRPYRSAEEKKNYEHYASEENVAKYIVQKFDNQHVNLGVKAPFGGLEVTGSGWVDLSALIESSRAEFIKNGQYLENNFDSNDLIISENSVSWNGFSIGKVLFCQGADGRENSLFSWLPFNPVKGQILDATFSGLKTDQIVNQGIFIMPGREAGQYRIGATYSWHDLDWNTSDDGRTYLEDKLIPLLDGVEYTIHRQQAGLRPASKDRRPLIGIHPEHAAVGLFNGLGTKGVTLGPYFANAFVAYLENGKELIPEVNIDRYFSLYYHY